MGSRPATSGDVGFVGALLLVVIAFTTVALMIQFDRSLDRLDAIEQRIEALAVPEGG